MLLYDHIFFTRTFFIRPIFFMLLQHPDPLQLTMYNLIRLSVLLHILYVSLMYVRPDDDSQKVETCWKYYILNFKYKLILTFGRLL